jgi:hypothetical protein
MKRFSLCEYEKCRQRNHSRPQEWRQRIHSGPNHSSMGRIQKNRKKRMEISYFYDNDVQGDAFSLIFRNTGLA